MTKSIDYDPELIGVGLRTSATILERLAAFQSAGLSYPVIADAVGVTETAVHNWRTNAQPREDVERAIDDLRYVLAFMNADGLPYDRATMVLKSRDNRPPFYRPLEIIAEQPELAFEIAHHAVNSWNRLQED